MFKAKKGQVMIDRYNNFLKRKKACPEKDTIIKAFLDEISLEEKFRLLDHVFSCPECRIQFIGVKAVWSKSGKILGNLETIPGTEDIRENFRKLSKQELRNLKSQGQIKNKILHSWRKIPVAVAVVGIIAFVTIFLISRGPKETGIERKIFQWQIELLQPKGEIIEPELVFQWTHLKEAKNYRLEIFDKELEILYASDPIPGNQFTLPGHVFLSFRRGEIYFWKVTALLGPNQEIESDFSKFKIKKD
jgi:hypothetical protein